MITSLQDQETSTWRESFDLNPHAIFRQINIEDLSDPWIIDIMIYTQAQLEESKEEAQSKTSENPLSKSEPPATLTLLDEIGTDLKMITSLNNDQVLTIKNLLNTKYLS
jgi:hypothetical protein